MCKSCANCKHSQREGYYRPATLLDPPEYEEFTCKLDDGRQYEGNGLEDYEECAENCDYYEEEYREEY